eukprot:911046-Pyramimonas_sp.AAC.1
MAPCAATPTAMGPACSEMLGWSGVSTIPIPASRPQYDLRCWPHSVACKCAQQSGNSARTHA